MKMIKQSKNIANTTYYQEKREKEEKYFKTLSCLPEKTKIILSPSKKYKLIVETYKTGEHSWDYKKGIVQNTSSNKILFTIYRNYSSFWYAWVKHPNHNEYLLCGEDYQGYVVLNLTTQKKYIYFPETGEKGDGFCWTSVIPSPNQTKLAVEGCVWASPFEIVIYDLSSPEKLPLPILQQGWADTQVEFCLQQWEDDDNLLLKGDAEYRKKDGKLTRLLPKKEQDELEIFLQDMMEGVDLKNETKEEKEKRKEKIPVDFKTVTATLNIHTLNYNEENNEINTWKNIKIQE